MAVAASGRSQAQEIEMRLERSFDRQDLLSDALTLAYGPQLAGILMIVAGVMNHAGRAAAHWAIANRKHPGLPLKDIDAWFEHSFAYNQALEGAVAVLMWARPVRKPDAPSRALVSDHLGVTIASNVLRALEGDVDEEQIPEFSRDLDKIRSLLRPILALRKQTR